MSRLYTSTNKIKFTNISDKYAVNKSVKGKVSALHSLIITYVVEHFKDTKKYKQQVVDALNIITYALYADEPLPFDWSVSNPLQNLPHVDTEFVEDTLGDIFLTVEGIEWDVKPTDFENGANDMVNITTACSQVSSSTTENQHHVAVAAGSIPQIDLKKSATNAYTKAPSTSTVVSPIRHTRPDTNVMAPTPKQDLYIQPPTVPQFDYSRPWIRGIDGADSLVIYTTLPEIPTKQNEISVTTDVTKMRYDELMRLYPNCIIHTRASVMYVETPGIELDNDIGLIFPIEGFTREQVIDNIIRYPHIFKLIRLVDGQAYSFYSHIEIDGELKGTLDVWDNLPESKIIPRQAEFVKEYVVRRYLLERDVKGIKHNYPIFGTLDEFLTLFMPSDCYIKRGYVATEDIAKQCVLSRVSYKQSRNPVLRRLGYV